jgi:hypothetical protein
MDGCIPITKSFLADLARCPWKAFQHKALRVPSRSGPAAADGKEGHGLVEGIRRQEITLSNVSELASTEEIAALVNQAIAMTTPSSHTDLIEQWIGIDHDGNVVNSRQDAIAHGYIDRIIYSPGATHITIEELKFGRKRTDDTKERDIYTRLTRAKFPEMAEIRFQRVWVRLRLIDQWVYTFDGPAVTIVESYNRPHNALILRSEPDALLDYIRSCVDVVKKMDPVPIPGDWCENWYGEPCQFLGIDCPLANRLPQLSHNRDMITDQAVGNAVKQVLSGVPLDQIDKHTAALSLYGIAHLKALLKWGESRVAERARDLGPIEINGERYGWYTQEQHTVDNKPWVMKTMLDHMPIEDVCNAINISPSSLKKISKRKYSAIRDSILSLGITTVGTKPKFGKLDN